MRRLLLPSLLGLCITCPLLRAETTGEVSFDVFRQQLGSAQGLVQSCFGDSKACQGNHLPTDEQVHGQAALPGFHVSWQWLHDTLDEAAKAPAPERRAAMQASRDHLEELALEVSPTTPPRESRVPFAAAHTTAARVLSGSEFRADAPPTWLDRQIARLQDALLRLFAGMGRVGSRNPWLAPLLEWICFGFAAGTLLFFLRRNLQRQALRLTLGEATAASPGALQNTDWIQEAEAAEAAGDWREAVHCRYWAAIAALEMRRAWRPNPTRTPREYVRLLRPGSDIREALQGLTSRFERTWYGAVAPDRGVAEAAKSDFTAIFTTLGNSDSSRGRPSDAHTAEGDAR